MILRPLPCNFDLSFIPDTKPELVLPSAVTHSPSPSPLYQTQNQHFFTLRCNNTSALTLSFIPDTKPALFLPSAVITPPLSPSPPLPPLKYIRSFWFCSQVGVHCGYRDQVDFDLFVYLQVYFIFIKYLERAAEILAWRISRSIPDLDLLFTCRFILSLFNIPHALRIHVLWVSRSMLDLDILFICRINCSLCDIPSFMVITKITKNIWKGFYRFSK